ncbi:MAG: MATE family efflux transporter, partial [Clostridiales bacterium]|nr:MATE family efflux transporter [Clostridiales bacterium]
MSLAVPMTAAQLINVLYSVVDRMYLGRLPGHLALTGLGLTIPIVSIIMGFANLCGTGGAPLCSICRGRGDQEEAERVMGNAFTLLLIFGGAVTALFLIFKRPILYLFGASDATYPYADAYMTVYLLGTVFVMIGLGMNPFINAQGFGRVGMMTVGLGAVVNIVLDPIFIFWLDLGVQGAAWATVIAQGCSAVWVLVFLTGRKAALRLRPRYMVLKPARVRKIVSLGLSGFFMNLTNSLVQVVCNATLQRWGGDVYVGVMTVLNSVREITTTPVMGITNAAQPVIGFNFGAGEYKRVRSGIQFMSAVCVGYTAAVWLCLFLFPQAFIRLFTSDPALLAAGVPSMHVYFFGFFMMALQFAGQSTNTALGRARQAVFFSLLRKAVIVIPLTLWLPGRFGLGVNGVFLAEPISNFLGGGACFVTMLLTVWPDLK